MVAQKIRVADNLLWLSQVHSNLVQIAPPYSGLPRILAQNPRRGDGAGSGAGNKASSLIFSSCDRSS